jgi:DNA (cytosine-5)-methyltransferase 3A
MNVLSLFDGISCARVALGDKVKVYYASEVDPYAVKIAKKNFPTTIHLGDVTKITKEDIKHPIDLLIGGSPCQDLSIAKQNRKGLDGERSKLFWEYVRLLKELKPKYFVLENVNSMSKENKAIITETLGVQPIMIDASLVSAQSRKRLFWTNIKDVTQPADRGIKLKDILEPNIESKPINKYTPVKKENPYFNQIGYLGAPNACRVGGQAFRIYTTEKKSTTSGVGLYLTPIRIGNVGNSTSQANRVYSTEGKSVCLSANGGGLGAKTGLYKTDGIRKLTPIECERLQSLPDNYTEGISNTQRYKCLGNAFNVEVIKHIISSL